MANLSEQPPMPPSNPDVPPNPSQQEAKGQSVEPAGWGRLAGRIAQWTTRGLLCALVLVACVGFGRQVLQWWYETPPESGTSPLPADPLTGLGEEDRMHVFRFRDMPWEFRRQVIQGDARKALDRLQTECAKATANCQAPVSLPGPQERRFLAALEDRVPVDRAAGWAVYRFHEAFPLVVGVREHGQGPECPSLDGQLAHQKSESTPLLGTSPQKILPLGEDFRPPKEWKIQDTTPPGTPSAQTKVASPGRSVVCWGFGIPAGEDRWTLYILVALPSGRLPPLTGGQSIPIPPESHLLYSLGVVHGAEITLFQGPPRPETWKTFYETFFRTHGGQQIGTWSEQANRWQGRFLWPASVPTLSSGDSRPDQQGARSTNGVSHSDSALHRANNDASGSNKGTPRSNKIVEIYFGPDTPDTWNGLIWIWAEDPSR